jgi:hypothetical protein
MQYNKERLSPERFDSKEFYLNMQAGLLAGVVAAGLTNSLEAITVAKQTRPDLDMRKMIR